MPVDLIFLDIQMPELTGIGLVRALENPPKVIFTTAYREYAVEGFELDVVDYLLKPISLPRLLRAIEKYRRQLQNEQPLPSHQAPRYLTVHANRQLVRIRLDDILFVESMSDYVKIHLADQVIVSKQRISHLEEQLAGEGFLRVHRSFLEAHARISSYTGDEIRIAGQAIPIGRSYKQAALHALGPIE
jgi:DNA-binding LytR/AlgR family response regulator